MEVLELIGIIVCVVLVLVVIIVPIVMYVREKNYEKLRKIYLGLKTGDKIRCTVLGEEGDYRVMTKGDLCYKVKSICDGKVCRIGWDEFIKKL